MIVELQSSYLLHARPYRETSLLVEMLTRDYGRIAMVARGVKRKRSPKGGLLQPFVPLVVSWHGKGSLFTLRQVEARAKPYFLVARRLVSGLYMNELLIRLLAVGDPHEGLFDHYQDALENLHSDKQRQQITLRLFEKRLLKAIGYDLQLTKDINTGDEVRLGDSYAFDPEAGPCRVNCNSNVNTNRLLFKGDSLLALDREEFDSEIRLLDAKRLMRQALAFRLGEKPLQTRKLL